MEHIKNILEKRAASLFATRNERGSREWSVFESVRGDTVEMFPVATPQKTTEHRVPNRIPIRRIHRMGTLFPEPTY